MAELKDGCVQPARGPLLPEEEAGEAYGGRKLSGGVGMIARVGKPAPDFEATAFVRDYGFKPVKLSDYKGQWIVLCFYPGDFTFV